MFRNPEQARKLNAPQPCQNLKVLTQRRTRHETPSHAQTLRTSRRGPLARLRQPRTVPPSVAGMRRCSRSEERRVGKEGRPGGATAGEGGKTTDARRAW